MITGPRQFMAHPDHPGGGLPQDTRNRLESRRNFVQLKQLFLAAVQDAPGTRGEWLRRQLRAAEEPIDLWLLRAPVMEALDAHAASARRWRHEVRRGIETTFQTTDPASSLDGIPSA